MERGRRLGVIGVASDDSRQIGCSAKYEVQDKRRKSFHAEFGNRKRVTDFGQHPREREDVETSRLVADRALRAIANTG